MSADDSSVAGADSGIREGIYFAQIFAETRRILSDQNDFLDALFRKVFGFL